MFIFPLGMFLGGIEQFRLEATGLFNSEGVRLAPALPMAALIAIAALLPIVTIFLYKKRPVQVRLCFAEMILLAGVQIVVCVELWRTMHSMTGFEPHAFTMSVAAALPVVAFVLVWLAMKGIARDEAKVRSLDRIR